MSRNLSIIIPAFNEQAIIGKMLVELKDLLARCEIQAEIIVVDDGSADATAKAALEAGVRVIRHRSNRGYGASLKTGISAATCDLVAITDADGTYPMKYLPEMLEQIENYDMVVGARIGANVKIPIVRKPAKWVLNKLANYVSGHKIPDLNSGLRIFRKSVVLQYFPILPNQFSWTTTITLALLCDNYAVHYIPIDYRPRVGKSKIVPWDAGAFTVLILRMAVLFKPLRVFLPVVGICLAYGLIRWIIDFAVLKHATISASALLSLVSALIILMIGMLADAISTRLGRIGSASPVARPHDAVELKLEDVTASSSAPANRT